MSRRRSELASKCAWRYSPDPHHLVKCKRTLFCSMRVALTGILPAVESFWGGAGEHGSLRRVTIATGSDANYQKLRLEKSKATCTMNMIGVGLNQNVLEGIHDADKKKCHETACLPEDIVLAAVSAPKKIPQAMLALVQALMWRSAAH